MGITSVSKNNLYVAVTHLCTNRCVFCPHKLELPDPPLDDIMNEIASYELDSFSEIVFAGAGEPTCRLYDMFSICRAIREASSTPIHVFTNGHASMILAEDTAPLFRGLVDHVSIMLGAPDSERYMQICRPRFGEDTFTGVMKFAREIAKVVPEVDMTAFHGTLSPEDFDRCFAIAQDIGIPFQMCEPLFPSVV